MSLSKNNSFLVISFHGHHENTRGCGRGCCGPETLGVLEAETRIERLHSPEEVAKHIADLDAWIDNHEHSGNGGAWDNGVRWEHSVIHPDHFNDVATEEGYSDFDKSSYFSGDDFSVPEYIHDAARALSSKAKAEALAKIAEEKARQAEAEAARMLRANVEAAKRREEVERKEFERLSAKFKTNG